MDEIIEEDVDHQIKIRFKEILDSVRPEEKKFIHPKSIKNFIYHLIDKPEKIKKSESHIIKEAKIKKQILAYLIEVQVTELNLENSRKLWSEYLKEVIDFMADYYDFASKKGGCTAIVFLLLGVIIDAVLISKDVTGFPFVTTLFSYFVFIENGVRIKRKRIYGMFY